MVALILAIVSSASMTLVLKLFRGQSGNRFGILLGNYLTCVVIALLSIPRKSMLWTGSETTALLGIIGGGFFVAALVAMQTSVRVNGATLTAAFAKLGLVVSLLVSVFWFGERPGVMQLIGIVLVLCALIVMHTGPKDDEVRTKKTSLGLLLLTLLTGGCGDGMAKVFDQLGNGGENVLYIFWVFFTSCVLTALLAIWEKRRTGKRIVLKEFAAGIAVGIPNYYSSYLLLVALNRLPALLVFPTFSTGTILLVFLFSTLFFRERPTRRQLLGILLIAASLVLLNINL